MNKEVESVPDKVIAEAIKDNKNRDLSIKANSPLLTWWARWSSIATPIFITAGIAFAGYMGDRFLNHVDKIGDAQVVQAREQTQNLVEFKLEMARQMGAVVGSVTIMRGDMNTINSHFADTMQILNSRIDVSNSRIDALSNWTKKNADDIDKLRDQRYGVPR